MTEIEKLQDILLTDLNTLVQHLDRFEEMFWSDYFRKTYNLIDNGDLRGIHRLNKIRGGMGSFTDLVICRINGHKIDKIEEDSTNIELMRLGDLVFKTADKIKRLNK